MDSPLYRMVFRGGSCLRALRTTVEYITAILFAVLFASFVLQIFMRFVLNDPLNWSEEVSVVCYIWIVFLCCSFVLTDKQHVVFSVITQALSENGRHVCSIVSSAILFAIFSAILYGSYDYVTFMKVEVSPALMIRKDYIYSIFVVFVFAICLRCLWTVIISGMALVAPQKYAVVASALADSLGQPSNEEELHG